MCRSRIGLSLLYVRSPLSLLYVRASDSCLKCPSASLLVVLPLVSSFPQTCRLSYSIPLLSGLSSSMHCNIATALLPPPVPSNHSPSFPLFHNYCIAIIIRYLPRLRMLTLRSRDFQTVDMRFEIADSVLFSNPSRSS